MSDGTSSVHELAPPSVRQAMSDRTLPPVIRVTMWTAAEWLALHEYRAIKPAAIAHAMGVGESAARNALARLVADGYLDERTEARTRMYRLFWSRRTSRARSF